MPPGLRSSNVSRHAAVSDRRLRRAFRNSPRTVRVLGSVNAARVLVSGRGSFSESSFARERGEIALRKGPAARETSVDSLPHQRRNMLTVKDSLNSGNELSQSGDPFHVYGSLLHFTRLVINKHRERGGSGWLRVEWTLLRLALGESGVRVFEFPDGLRRCSFAFRPP